LPDRNPRSFGGDLLVVGIQVAVVMALPLLAAAWLGEALDRSLGTSPWMGLVLILVGLGVAGLGVYLILRRYIALNPIGPPSETARAAGRRWQREIDEQQRRRETGEEE
jgi:F0F1-type ATP synthase assembly protein I